MPGLTNRLAVGQIMDGATGAGPVAVNSSGQIQDPGTYQVPAEDIADGAVTLAKLANIANGRVLARSAAGEGPVESLTMSQLAALVAAQGEFPLVPFVASGSDPAGVGQADIWFRSDLLAFLCQVAPGTTVPLSPLVSSWTPALAFATPGDLAVAYTAQDGQAVRWGNTVLIRFRLACTPTFTTASGSAQITGLPYISADGVFANSPWFIDPTGIFVISQENIFVRPAGTSTLLNIQSITTGGGATPLACAVNNILAGVSPNNRTIRSGQALDLRGALIYRTAGGI